MSSTCSEKDFTLYGALQKRTSIMPSAPYRISFVLSDLRCGGVQRACISVAGGLAARGHSVEVLTFSDARSDVFSMPASVARIPLGLRRTTPTPVLKLIPTNLRRLRTLRKVLLASDPAVVISHAPQLNVPTLLALNGSGLPVIVTEHGDVPATHWRKATWYRARRIVYRSAFRIVSVSRAVDRNVAWAPPMRRLVIPNPIFPPTASVEATELNMCLSKLMQGDYIVSMGRLETAKGFDLLIAAFARIADAFSQWRLLIIGDGALRADLEQQVNDLNLSGRIVFAGLISQPGALLRGGRLFVMASRYEGFPLAHAEALACGLPVIATDCPSRPSARGRRTEAGGVRELIRQGVDGVLVPPENPAALAGAMSDLLSDRAAREKLAHSAPAVLDRFAYESILVAWERVITEAASDSLRLNHSARDSVA